VNDDVLLDASSGNVSVIGKAAQCRSLDCTGYAGTLRLETGLRIATMAVAPAGRVLTLSPDMALSLKGSAFLQLNTWGGGVRSMLTCGKKLPSTTAYNITLDDGLDCKQLSTAYTFDANGFNVSSDFAITCSIGDVSIAGSGVRCQIWDAKQATTVDAEGSTITIAGTYGRPAFIDGVREYHNIVIDSTAYTPQAADGGPVPPACLFGDYHTTPTLVLNSLSIVSFGETSIEFNAGSAFHLIGDKKWASGNPLGNVVLSSVATGSPWLLSADSGAVEVEYATISESVAIGGATFAAGFGSVDAGGNSGWGF
jgi:hypothetical protein